MLTGSYRNRDSILDEYYSIASHTYIDIPGSEQVFDLSVCRVPFNHISDFFPSFFVLFPHQGIQDQVFRTSYTTQIRLLDNNPSGRENFEIVQIFDVVSDEPGHLVQIGEKDCPDVLLSSQDIQCSFLIFRSSHALDIGRHDCLGGRLIQWPVHDYHRTKCAPCICITSLDIDFLEAIVSPLGGKTRRNEMFHHGYRRCIEILEDV